jgi:phosphoenolpyruvate carboxykinase (GTP)
LNLTPAALDLLLTVDPDIWTQEAALIPEFYDRFGDATPKGLWDEYAALVERLRTARAPQQVVAAE